MEKRKNKLVISGNADKDSTVVIRNAYDSESNYR